VTLYSGPDYQIDGRFSVVLMFLSMAFVYGTAMPLFFPIGLFGYVVLWVNERLQLCWFYKMPPAYDTEITYTALTILKYLPLLSLPFVYWQLGNRQIFHHQVSDITVLNKSRLSGHTISQSLHETY